MAVKLDPSVVLSQYLVENCTLWVWDWDNTVITGDAYLRHTMDDDTIANLSETQLAEDIPYVDYFRSVIQFLYSKGRKIGFASFGIYSIIQAYMNRIFGMNQHYFDASNIKAFRRNKSDMNIQKKLPLNKNAMIHELMEFYKVSTFESVCLFDDAPSNIADAMAIGIVAVQIDCLFNPDIMPLVDAKMRTDTSNTRPLFYTDGQRKIWKKIPVVNGEAVLCNPDVEYKPVNGTKKCLHKPIPIDVDLTPIFTTEIPPPTLPGPTIFPTKSKTGPFITRPPSDFDYQSVVKANLPGIELQKKFNGDMTYQDFIKSHEFTEGFANVDTDDCTSCYSPIMQKINIVVLAGLVLALAIFIWRIYQSHTESDVMIVWSMILIFVILTAIMAWRMLV
jgi:hypothetical protein